MDSMRHEHARHSILCIAVFTALQQYTGIIAHRSVLSQLNDASVCLLPLDAQLTLSAAATVAVRFCLSVYLSVVL